MKKMIIVFMFSVAIAYSADTTLIKEMIFPVQDLHVHGSTLVECPNGDILVAWFQGSGERQAEDVRIMGARLKKDSNQWSEPFEMADTPGLPDINPALFIDPNGQLWLFYYAVIAHQWETSLLKYRVAMDFQQDGAPKWTWQDVLHVKPGSVSERGIQPNDRFLVSVEKQLAEYENYLQSQGVFESEGLKNRWDQRKEKLVSLARGDDWTRKGRLYKDDGSYEDQQMGYPWFRRMGWQTKNKPVLVDNRMILPLYSDGFSFSLMAITDNWGKTWQTSVPLVGVGNIQPSIAKKSNGELVAYMRDNGPPPKRLHVSRSQDNGETWSMVVDSELPNSGSGSDIVTLKNGHWVLLNNDVADGRHSLAVHLSMDEGKTWSHIRHLELDERGIAGSRYHYPAVIQGKDGSIHVSYSYFERGDQKEKKSIKYARFTEEWIINGD